MVVKTRYVLLALIGVLPVALLIGCSRAHIKVVDQYGEPVEGAFVQQVDHQSTWLPVPYAGAGSNEVTERYSDEEGRLTLPADTENFPVAISEVKKPGYQFRAREQIFRQFRNNYWGGNYDFTYNNPLIIRGWKREEQPELTYVSAYVSIPDVLETCTIKLDKKYPPSLEWWDKRRRNKEHVSFEPPVVIKIGQEKGIQESTEGATSAQQSDRPVWRAQLSVQGGKIQETDDLFMNRAPESGYQEMVVSEGKSAETLSGFSGARSFQVFMKSKDDPFYGGGIFLFSPSRKGVAFFLWFNFDGSRNIMRHPSETFWRLGRQPGRGDKRTHGYKVKCQELEDQ